MTMTLAPPLAAAIAAGATIVTPNNRLARRITALHDDAMRERGLRTWPAACVLPWRAWLGTLWTERAEHASAAAERLLSAAQSSFLWQRVVADEMSREAPLVDARGAAALAQVAWTTMHAYGAGRESWRGFMPQGDDETAFVRWADRYAAALARAGGDDAARAADTLARAAAAGELPMHERVVVLAGFVELDPQQQRLIAALAEAGAQITHADPLPPCAVQTTRVEAHSPVDELASALEWARTHAMANPSATIGVAIENLAERRDEVIALAEDTLCAPLQWPGREDVPRPYNVSLGAALADVPIVASALDVITLAHVALPVGRAAALVRSPYLAGSARWPQRAAIERVWLDEGRRDVDEAAFVGALARDPDGAVRASSWKHAPSLPRRATPRAFIDAWRVRLAAAGWPGERTLGSAEYQARMAFEELLASFAAFAPLARELAAPDALASLRALAADTLFQPESPRAPIQILGLLEAAGMPFDALWIVGLSADRWPAPPRPDPLLPLSWQRERDVPHASAPRVLSFARALTDQLARAAPRVIASHAKHVDDHPSLPSSLTAAWPLAPIDPPRPRTASIQFDTRPRLERIADDCAPALSVGEAVRGGANLIETQSECPFRAAARYRLRTDTWPAASAGLAFWERGRLLHTAVAALWRDVQTHARLVELSSEALDAQIARAVAEAIAKLGGARARALPPVVAASEPSRLAQLIRQWLDSTDRERPPFTVRAVESDASLTLGGITLSLRLDRIDALDSGGFAIIDYKTGALPALRQWFQPRPRATQLALYALAFRAAERDASLRAVALAPIAPGNNKVVGIAADERAWPGLALPREAATSLPDWATVEDWWLDTMVRLASDFASGSAAVDPRERTICNRCGMQSLCRIEAVRPSDETGGDG